LAWQALISCAVHPVPAQEPPLHSPSAHPQPNLAQVELMSAVHPLPSQLPPLQTPSMQPQP
jgi:hypothetical protein